MFINHDIFTNRNMLCPLCRTKLVLGKRRRYETLDEHVCDPNGTSPVRNTFVCPREGCSAHEKGVFWANDGEGPYNTRFREHYDWQDGNPIPYNSYHRKIYFAVEYHDEDREFTWGKLTIKREVHYESNDFGEKVGRRVHYRIIWDGAYYMSGFRMFRHCLRVFYKRDAWPSEKEHQVKEAKHFIEMATPRGYYKPEWWRKAVKWWIRLCHRHVYVKALESGR